jgi:hypothetical protein
MLKKSALVFVGKPGCIDIQERCFENFSVLLKAFYGLLSMEFYCLSKSFLLTSSAYLWRVMTSVLSCLFMHAEPCAPDDPTVPLAFLQTELSFLYSLSRFLHLSLIHPSPFGCLLFLATRTAHFCLPFTILQPTEQHSLSRIWTMSDRPC